MPNPRVTGVSEMGNPKVYYQSERVTLYCGDAIEVLPIGASGGVMVTDPPYGMGFRSGMGGVMGECEIQNDGDATVRDAIVAMWQDSAIVFGRWSVPKPSGTRMVLTWEKGNHVGMGDLSLPWKPNTEEIYIIGHAFEGHRGSSVLQHLAIAGCVGRANTGYRNHPTEKPVGLMVELIEKCVAGVIVDPFMGSGTTGVAAIRLGRRFIGIEIDEGYCAIAKRRIQEAEQAFALFDPPVVQTQSEMFPNAQPQQ